jgi:hypothetical protein
MMMRWFYPGLVLAVCLLALACSGKQDAKKSEEAQVSGKVDLDSQPLDEGKIVFDGEDGTIPDELPIKNGSFEGKVKLGKKKIKIWAFKTEEAPPSATAGVTQTEVCYIAEKYNVKSVLSGEVTESGLKPNKFDVKKK